VFPCKPISLSHKKETSLSHHVLPKGTHSHLKPVDCGKKYYNRTHAREIEKVKPVGSSLSEYW